MAIGLRADVRVDLRGVRQYERLATTRNQYTVRLYEKWAFRARTFWFNRFKRLSAGGGEWPPLRPATIERKGHAAILRDTDTLLNSLTPVFAGFPGQWQRIRDDGVNVGIGGGARHPKARMTVRRLAEIHHTGEGRNPIRRVISELPRQTVRLMEKDQLETLGVIDRKTAIFPIIT